MSIQDRQRADVRTSRLRITASLFAIVLCAPLSAQVTQRVSVATSGAQGNQGSFTSQRQPESISANNRFVAFESDAWNLVPGDTNNWTDVFVRDRQTGTTERVSVDSGGAQGNERSNDPSISADGRFVAFHSIATNLDANDSNGVTDVFVHDRQSGLTERVSLDSGGGQWNGFSGFPSISADGRFVAFDSVAPLDVLDTNGFGDVFVRDRQSGTTELVSVDSGGAQGNNGSQYSSISADGRFVAFESFATNLVAGDTNLLIDIFVRDRQSGTTERVSLSTGGAQGNQDSEKPSISADGRFVAFHGQASNLVGGDTNGVADVFVRDRNAAGFTSLCNPGVGGVIACPCSNPPASTGRGCNNSAATGGAILSASGIAYLSSDSLVFTTSGEKPTATSIVLQGTGSATGGLVYGQGVRCVAGTLKRLFVKTAVAGSITAPNFGAGDPTVSARSAALGNTILPGQTRWYLVYYRDSTVLGGCPASSTFNTTQTGRVDWSLQARRAQIPRPRSHSANHLRTGALSGGRIGCERATCLTVRVPETPFLAC